MSIINLSINLDKIDKTKIITGKKGKEFVFDNPTPAPATSSSDDDLPF